MIGYLHQKKMIEKNHVYKYYLAGLAVKLFSSIIFLLVYIEYYAGGDTTNYILGSIAMSKLFFHNLSSFFTILFQQADFNTSWSFFNEATGWPPHYMWKGGDTRFVIALTSFSNTLGMRAFFPTTLLVATFSYLGVWKLYLFFTDFFPHLTKQMAIAILFVPSVLFWGSGVMKDTYTFAGSAWFVYNIYMIFFKKQKIPVNIFLGIINVIVVTSIKPYIFMALFPGIIVWALFRKIKDIKNKAMATLIMPFMIIIGFGLMLVVFSSLQSKMGKYGSFDSAVKQAQTIQEDLLRSEQYGSNSYNVGKIEGTPAGMLKVAPMAIIAGMYRPFLWEARNPVMIISGIENFILLILTFYLLIRLKLVKFIRFIFSDPILLFSMIFTIFFMFAVGTASANFGALVRYRIPAMPFFIASVFIMLDKYKVYKNNQSP